MNVICTIISQSHLGYANALYKSLRDSGNFEDFFVLVTDLSEEENINELNFNVVYLSNLNNTFPPFMEYYYDAFEFCCALKPFFVRYLFGNVNIEKVIFLDCDIYVVGSFSKVWLELSNITLILTPHHILPLPLYIPYINEIDIIKFGFLNGGFYAWSRTVHLEKILDWMCGRFSKYGFCDISQNMFVDQLLLPLTLAYFPDSVQISNYSGLNIAYWNAYERNVTKKYCKWEIDDEIIIFFHMSGYRLTSENQPCAYLSFIANKQIIGNAKWFKDVIIEYRELLIQNETKMQKGEYKFNTFKGITLNRKLRQLIFKQGFINKRTAYYWKILFIEKVKIIKLKFSSTVSSIKIKI